MRLVSTRDAANGISPLQAVIKGIASDGGLFVPQMFPKIPLNQIKVMAEKTYAEAAADVLGMFFDLDDDFLRDMTRTAYAGFDTPDVAPVVKLNPVEYVLELFHGPTLAFKDFALQILPRLISEALKGKEEKLLVLTATSGDTGKAALEGFKDVPGTDISVFYPEEGVSYMQKLQMSTQTGKNVHVSAVRGNFDDAQTGIKRLFADKEFNKKVNDAGYFLSSANSINFGRLAPQIVYYLYAYSCLAAWGVISLGDRINITVPTGNFGNILAAYYAKQMGLPIKRLICASNKNNVLTDFFDSGRYMANREFFKTASPSMDIVISSNMERLLFEAHNRDSTEVVDLMANLSNMGSYEIDSSVYSKLQEEFYGDFCDDSATYKIIKSVYERFGYVMDTHTAVAQGVYEKYAQRSGDDTVNLIVATASPYKFAQEVLYSITGKTDDAPFGAAEELARITGISVPNQINILKNARVLHKSIVSKEDMASEVLRFIASKKLTE